MTLLDRSKFKLKPTKNKANTKINDPHHVEILSYFEIIRNDINEKYSTLKVISYVSGNTKIDDLLKLNKEWSLKKLRKRYPDSPMTPYELSARNNETQEVKSVEITVNDSRRIASGIINYTGHRYYLNMRKKQPELIVYEGSGYRLMEYLGFKEPTKRMADKVSLYNLKNYGKMLSEQSDIYKPYKGREMVTFN